MRANLFAYLSLFGFLWIAGCSNEGAFKADRSGESEIAQKPPILVNAPDDSGPPVWDFRGLGSVEEREPAPCVPVDEGCNGRDDDCDGVVDEMLVRSCGEENARVCSLGQQTCAFGFWGACDGLVLGEREVCNNVDDDCDGQTDEEALPENTLCNVVGAVSQCRRGSLYCEDGEEICTALSEPTVETCNGRDDDCDGQIDEEENASLCECRNEVFCVNGAGASCVGGRCAILIQNPDVLRGQGLLGADFFNDNPEAFQLDCEEIAPGFDNCNDDFEDGCETNLENDVNHCGACGRVCEEGFFCTANDCRPKGVAVAASERNTCMIAANGQVYCWGANIERQLGDPELQERAFAHPRLVPGIEAVIPRDGRAPQIAVGQSHVCVLAWNNRNREEIACWGSFRHGELGRFDLRPDPGFIEDDNVDLQGFPRETLGKVTKLVAGEDNNCALYSSGQLICWGENYRGEVTGSRADCDRALFMSCGLLPTRVLLPARAVDVSCSYGRCSAVLTDGTVRYWGNFRGRIADGQYGFREEVEKVVDGRNRRCALSENRSRVECVVMSRDLLPEEDVLFPHSLEDGPLRFPNPGEVTDLQLKFNHACAIQQTEDGESGLYCWGLDQYGEMGNIPREGGTYIPQPVEVWGLFGNSAEDLVRKVAVGKWHTCALFDSGKVQCFGDNLRGYYASPVERDIIFGMLGRGERHPAPGYIPVDIIFQ